VKLNSISTEERASRVIPISAGWTESSEQDEIVERAFQRWLSRAFRNGTPEEAYLNVVREVRKRAASVRPAGKARVLIMTPGI
jgi:hypothetical protein